MNGFVAEFGRRLQAMPAIAILRGLVPDDAIAVCQALLDAGISIAEVPLNSPEPFDTIARLRAHFGPRMAIGAGTVLDVESVERLATTGCQFCVAPNTDPDVIRASLRLHMLPLPGFSTASEAFAAISAGARYIKAFPAQAASMSALKAVLPDGVRMIAVGGATPELVDVLRAAGASGFGIGSDLYRPGCTAQAVGARAREWVAALSRPTTPRVQRMCDSQAMVGEGPVALGGQILWVDPSSPRLLRCTAEDGQWTQMPLSEPVWSLGVLPDGRLVGNGESRFVAFDTAMRGLKPGPDIDVGAGCRLNDLTIDAHGGLWATTMHRGVLAGRGGIVHASAFDARARPVASGLGVGNGLAFSSDGRTLLVIDTLSRTLLAYPADIVAGTLGEPVIVTDFLGLPGKPDGMAMATDGTVWVAMWGAGEVVQIGANGACLRRITVPAPHVGSVCFGTDGDLFVTTSRVRLSDAQLAAAPGSGDLYRIRLT